MTPGFEAEVYEYTATTENASDKISAAPAEEKAVVAIQNGSTVVTNGGNATWNDGENILTITVTNGTTVCTYTVTVTKETA